MPPARFYIRGDLGTFDDTGYCEDDTGVFSMTCLPGYTLAPNSNGQCYQPASQSCAEGQSQSGDVCIVGVPQYTCPQGYGYNVLTGMCQIAPLKATKPPRQ